MKGLIFSYPMLLTLRTGRQTQMRRLMDPQPVAVEWWLHGKPSTPKDGQPTFRDAQGTDWTNAGPFKPKLKTGDRFYVRETWARMSDPLQPPRIVFRADQATWPASVRWSSPIHLKAQDARLFYRCTAVKTERVNEISEEDAIAEGVQTFPQRAWRSTWAWTFATRWDLHHGEGRFKRGEWVWAYTFEPITREEALGAA